MDDLEISSNWACDDEKLKKLVTHIQPDNKMTDIEDVTPEKCVCLVKDEGDTSHSKPELQIKLKYSIKEIKLFSEGSLIEVFGVHDEYLLTCIPEFVDDWEGMAVYRAKIILPNINICKIKFTRIKESGRLWLYSVQLSVSAVEEPSNNSLFNFENVNKLINNSSQEISEKAEKFKKFFEMYAKNSKSQPFSVQNLLNIFNEECNVQLSDCKRAMIECLSNSSRLSSSENIAIRKDDVVKRNDFSVECQYLKGYIDRKFIEMREDIMNCIESKFCELKVENNSKLDKIIKLLENSKGTSKGTQHEFVLEN